MSEETKRKLGESQRRRFESMSAERRQEIRDAHRGPRVNLEHYEGTSYFGLHDWLRDRHPKTGVCEECGNEGKTDYALIKGRGEQVFERDGVLAWGSRYREDYIELHHACHRKYDFPIEES